MNWLEINDLVESGRLQELTRSQEVTEAYIRHRGECNVQEHVLNSLHWKWTEIQQLNSEQIGIFSDPSLYAVTKNDFPYDFEAGIHHLVVWSKIYIRLYNDKNEKRIEVKAQIEEFLASHLHKFGLRAGEDYCWFMNYVSLQSIRSISHLHLIIKSKDPQLIDQILKNF